MSLVRWAAVAVAGLLLPLAAPRGEDFRETAVGNIEKHTGWKKDHSGDPKEIASPFRKALKAKFDDRERRGNTKKPKITFEVPTLTAQDGDVGYGRGECDGGKRCPVKGYVVRYKALTSLEYNGPDEIHEGKGGGRAEWPPLMTEKKVWNADTGKWDTVEVTDYTEEYKAKVAQQASEQNPQEVAWKVDPNDPEDPGKYEFGQEPQIEDVSEEITFTFQEEDKAQGEAFFRQLSAAMAEGSVGAEKAILMGFTYQGPNIDYTIGSSKRVCIFKCFYLWDIKAGFALDFGLGLRVPAYSTISGPLQMVAGNAYAFSSRIDTEGAYGDWNPPEFTAAGVRPYSERGGEPGIGNGEGNEFVMYFEFFAGAYVKILGVNVCPYCQYVDVNVDYTTSFGTPFGEGTRFPLPWVEIPVKDFDYGIVSLLVGLYVRPDVTSKNIGAVASTGEEVRHTGPGVPSTFYATACIDQEAAKETPKPPRWLQTVSLDEYRYHFDSFKIVLGAYLDLGVAGYGVWNPYFDFLTLDVSSALRTAGVYLPDHLNCNFAFSCAQAPAPQQVAWTAEVLDESPPSTKLDPSGTPGKNGWWTSDVTATLTAEDNPVGCGSGVETTSWSLDGGGLQTANPFQLTAEKKMVVSYGSSDRDGKAETFQNLDVWIDKTPPEISGAPTTAANGYGWYNYDVTIHFVASDATSGIAALTADTILSAEEAGQTATGTAEDQAGLTATYTVGGINIDKTKPTVVVTGPEPGRPFRNTDAFQIAWTATDALSDVASESATLDGDPATRGQLVEVLLLGGGDHTVAASAKDKAGNDNGDSVTFLVDVDADGLLAAVARVCAEAWVTKTGTCNSLRAKALEARASLAAGLKSDARGQLGAFLNELDAQQDKSVLDRGYRLLRTDAQWVLDHYAAADGV